MMYFHANSYKALNKAEDAANQKITSGKGKRKLRGNRTYFEKHTREENGRISQGEIRNVYVETHMWLKFALTYAFVTILSCALKLSSIFMSVKILVRCKNHYKLESILTIFFLHLHENIYELIFLSRFYSSLSSSFIYFSIQKHVKY